MGDSHNIFSRCHNKLPIVFPIANSEELKYAKCLFILYLPLSTPTDQVLLSSYSNFIWSIAHPLLTLKFFLMFNQQGTKVVVMMVYSVSSIVHCLFKYVFSPET